MKVMAELQFPHGVPATLTSNGEAHRAASLVTGPAVVDNVLYVNGHRVGEVQELVWNSGREPLFVDSIEPSDFVQTTPAITTVRGWIELPLPAPGQ